MQAFGQHWGWRQTIGALLFGGLALLAIHQGQAADAQPQPTSRPLLAELNQETQSLFTSVAGSIVRVELPVQTQAVLRMQDPLQKWEARLDPQMRRELETLEKLQAQDRVFRAEIQPASSTTMPSAPRIVVLQERRFVPNSIGVVLDDQGHVMIPAFINRDAFDGPVPVLLGNGKPTSATFVASDQHSDITVLKLQNAAARAASLTSQRPDQGALLLVISLTPDRNRLAVWEGWEPDFAALVNIDGQVSGFTRGGHFYDASACRHVAQQLIEHGTVFRGHLGVGIETVFPDDPQRVADASLGTVPAIRIVQVAPGSAAERAGLHRGDLILSFAGEPVSDAASFGAATADRHGPTQMVILRNGQRITVTADLK